MSVPYGSYQKFTGGRNPGVSRLLMTQLVLKNLYGNAEGDCGMNYREISDLFGGPRPAVHLALDSHGRGFATGTAERSNCRRLLQLGRWITVHRQTWINVEK